MNDTLTTSGAQHVAHDTTLHSVRQRIRRFLASLLGVTALGVFGPAMQVSAAAPFAVASDDSDRSVPAAQGTRIWMTVGERRFAMTLTDNAAARSFVARLPLNINMTELNGNEKKAELPAPLPTDSYRPGTIRNGDLMLYGSDTLVIFYLSFASGYSYTRLGRADNPDGLAQALGAGAVKVKFSRQ